MKALLLFALLSGVALPLAASDAVIIGRVEESRTIVHRKVGSALFYVRLKVEVTSVESGHDLVRGAKYLDLRCWQEGAEGHHPIPADGATFRGKLKQETEGFWVPAQVGALELLEDSAERLFPPPAPRKMGLGGVVTGLLGVALLATVAFLRLRRQGPRDRSWGEGPQEKTNGA